MTDTMDRAEHLIITKLGGSRIDSETAEAVTVYTCATHIATNARDLMRRAGVPRITMVTDMQHGCYHRECTNRSRFAMTCDKIQTAFIPPF